MQVLRQDWDNLSDDVCYINPEPSAQARAGGHEKDRQKKKEEMTTIEMEAWKSAENCARVCEEEDVPDDDEWDPKQKTVPRGPDNTESAATASDTEKAEDTGPSDEATREQRKQALNDRKKKRTCFQYRWHDEVCCTAKSFKLGAPKAKPSQDKPNERWTSGWDLKGINDWIDAMGECKEVAWKTPEA